MITFTKFIGFTTLFGLLLITIVLVSCDKNVKPLGSKPTVTDTKKDTTQKLPVTRDTTVKITLSGKKGNSNKWKSGWLDLATPFDFKAGDTLRVKVKGTAKMVLFRLLDSDDAPDSQAGIVGEGHSIGSSGEIVVVLPRDYSNIKQVSVHGGKPWDMDLVANNGQALLESVTVTRKKR